MEVPGLHQLVLTDFAGARIPELQALHKAVGGNDVVKPEKRCLRRRTTAYMSRKRAVKKKQHPIAKQMDEKTQRKHVRRPKFLLSTDREDSFRLPTHIWHAKRMVMEKKWGFALAEKRCDKSISAAVRAYREHSVIYDMSYHRRLLLEGERTEIIESIQPLLAPGSDDIDENDGSQEMDVLLYHNFPYGMICTAKLMWISTNQLVMWIHAAAFTEVQQALEGSTTVAITPCALNYCRFEVCGKEATKILQKVFFSNDQRIEWENFNPRAIKSCCVSDVRNLKFEQGGRVIRKNKLEEMNDHLLVHRRPEEVPEFTCPITGKLFSDTEFVQHANQILLQLGRWAESSNEPFPVANRPEQRHHRDNCALKDGFSLSEEKPTYEPDHIFNANPSKASDFPVTLVSKRGNDDGKNYVEGWDVIVPIERALNVWRALVFSGCRAIGFSERDAINTFCLIPRDFPDTNSGSLHWHELAVAEETRYLARPKAKRTPYKALGTDSPFQPDWQSILFPEKETSEISPFCVLRGQSFIAPFPFSGSCATEALPLALPTLVQVAIDMPRRGLPAVNSMICLPTEEQLERWQNDSRWTGDEENLQIIGYVTSIIPRTTRAIGLCDCELVQELFLTHQKTTDGLAMLRNPTSRQNRPCRITVLA